MSSKVLLVFITIGLLMSACGKNTNEIPVETFTVYMVAYEGTGAKGKSIGCNDVLVDVQVEAEIYQSSLEAAMEQLFTMKGTDKYQNYVKGPGLLLAQVTIANSVADVYIKGDFDISSVCDVDRIREQIYSTGAQFTNINKINYYINDKTLDEYLRISKDSFK